jgi:hypothetical protein
MQGKTSDRELVANRNQQWLVQNTKFAVHCFLAHIEIKRNRKEERKHIFLHAGKKNVLFY